MDHFRNCNFIYRFDFFQLVNSTKVRPLNWEVYTFDSIELRRIAPSWMPVSSKICYKSLELYICVLMN